MSKKNVAEVVLALFGAFLVIDSLVLHLLFFVYPAPIAFLDSYIDHWIIGFIFVFVAWVGVSIE